MSFVTPPDVPLYLLPGMGADARLFRPQLDAFSNAVVPPWLAPRSRESLADYARRFADLLRPSGPCFVGGASFGGFVALEMAPHLDALGCFLIGSARGPWEMPIRIRWLRPFARTVGLLPFRLLAPSAWLARQTVGQFSHPLTRSFLRHLQEADASFLRWASRAALTWKPSPATACVRVFQIHGEYDRVLPAKRTRADVVLPGGGHLISLTHASAVNDFLRRHMMAASCPTSS
jgi:pimeloyl-ACP methyl ester carboxylesterase